MAAEIPDGAFVVARAIFNSSLWTMRPEDCKLAVTCLGIANWKPKKWFDGEKDIMIQRGQFVRSLDDLAEASRLTKKTLRTSLQHLLNCGFLARNRAQTYVLYTIPKYSHYQDLTKYSDSAVLPDGHTIGHRSGTARARRGHGAGTKQEREEGKERKEGRGGASATPPPPHAPDALVLMAEASSPSAARRTLEIAKRNHQNLDPKVREILERKAAEVPA